LRILTPLGREQAALTGQRIGQYIRGINKEFGPCNVRVVRVSALERAKETAAIVVENLGLDENDGGMEIELAEPDAMLNEGRYVMVCYVLL
jgi:serine/threonine-protein phosphatase PGAM5